LALTLSTSDGRSVDIVRLRTKTPELVNSTSRGAKVVLVGCRKSSFVLPTVPNEHFFSAGSKLVHMPDIKLIFVLFIIRVSKHKVFHFQVSLHTRSTHFLNRVRGDQVVVRLTFSVLA
jgi:hypothetical protein